RNVTASARKVGRPQVRGEGSAFDDYDNDGDYDLYVRNEDEVHLYRNDNGVFTDVATQAGLFASSFYWGDSWADVDNDGDLDLLFMLADAPAKLMLNNGDGTFTADTAFEALNVRSDNSAWADVDGDGDLDVVGGPT